MEEWGHKLPQQKNNMEKGWKRDYSRYKEFFLNIWRVYNTKPSLKIYLELILSLSTVAVFAVFAIKPTVLTIIELNKEISSKEETISKLLKRKEFKKTPFILETPALKSPKTMGEEISKLKELAK